MTESVPVSMAVPNASIVDRYEELRRQVLNLYDRAGGGLGLALFFRQGMKGSMEACSRCEAARPMKAQDKSRPVEGIVPWDLRNEVVAILAGMALSIGQEMRA